MRRDENSTTANEPDWRDLERIISTKEYAALENVSEDTIRRRTARGEGAPRIRISERRVGFRMRDVLTARKVIG